MQCPNKNSKITKLNLKKKKNFFLYRPVLPEIGRYGRYEIGTADIFSNTKQGDRVYRITDWYGIFRSYQPVWYGIDNLASNPHKMARNLLTRVKAVPYI